jgi:hypothetical protein
VTGLALLIRPVILTLEVIASLSGAFAIGAFRMGILFCPGRLRERRFIWLLEKFP